MKKIITDKLGNEIKKGMIVTGYQYQGGLRTGKVNCIKRDGRLDVSRERLWVDPQDVTVVK